MALSTLLFPAVVILPIANMGALFGHPQWLAAYLALPALALLVTALALLLSLGLVRWVGVRRAKAVGQTVAALTGLVMAFAGQIPRLAMPYVAWASGQDLGKGWIAVLLWPGRAFMGDPLPLALLVLVCVGTFAAVVTRTGTAFVAASAAAAGAATPKGRAAKAARFHDRLGPSLRRKEWRLMRRHPQLTMLLFQQASGAIVLGLSMQQYWRAQPVVISLLMVPVAALAAGVLAKLALTDGAADLINAAPVPARRLRWAKVEAASLPPLAAVAVAALAVLHWSPWTALTVLSCGVAATVSGVVSSLWVQPLTGTAQQQALLRPNKKGAGGKAVGRTLVEMLMGYGWMATAFMMQGHNIYAGLVAAGLLGLLAILRTPL